MFHKFLIPLITTITLLSFSLSALAYSDKWPLRASGEVRYLKFIKVYDISLFSPRELSAETILRADVSKCLQLNYTVDLSVDKFRLATQKILKQQHNDVYLASIKGPLEALQSAYKPVKKGDIYRLCYHSATRKLQLELNNKQLVEIQSAELAKAYIGIWLSANKPISRPLYQQLFKKTPPHF